MPGFLRGRVDIKGACGCAWSYIEPGVAEDEEASMLLRVQGMVTDHAQERGHSPTVVVVREHFFSADAPEYHPDFMDDALTE